MNLKNNEAKFLINKMLGNEFEKTTIINKDLKQNIQKQNNKDQILHKNKLKLNVKG